MFHHIFSIFAAVMLGLLRLISALAISMKLPSHLWSSGRRWLLQYEQSQPLQLYPSRPTFFLQRKHRERSACLAALGYGTYGILKLETSLTICYYLGRLLSG